MGYVHLLMISQAVLWTQTPSATPLQPIKWNAHFLIMFNFWWSAGLVNGLKPHLPSLSSQKNEMLLFVLHSTSDVGQTGQWTQTPSTSPLQPKKWNASFMDYTQLLMIGRAEWWTQTPSTTRLQPKKMKCSIFGLRSLLMICQADWWTWTSSATFLLPKKWNAQFSITFNFWWSAKLVNWPKVHLPAPLQPISKMKCSFFDPVQLLMISWAGQWT